MVFRGVVPREEVTPLTLGMTSAKWLQVPTELIRIADLWMTQEGVYFEALIAPSRTPVGGDEYPHVVLYRARALLEDGHTRVTRAALAGEYLVECRVLIPPFA